MSSDAFDVIVKDLATLRSAEGGKRVFGASDHRFILNAPLTHAELSKFEIDHGARLPDEYRTFLLRVGNGGAGPFYGLFRLGEMDDSYDHKAWSDSFVGDLAKPFPHHIAWNDLSKYPADDVDSEQFDDQRNAFEEAYWSSRLMNGAIPICHHGCALRSWLVVTGQEAGQIWQDKRADLGGILPAVARDGKRLTFLRWYREWLDEALKAAG